MATSTSLDGSRPTSQQQQEQQQLKQLEQMQQQQPQKRRLLHAASGLEPHQQRQQQQQTWAHVSMQRQSPDWRPRRASVAVASLATGGRKCSALALSVERLLSQMGLRDDEARRRLIETNFAWPLAAYQTLSDPRTQRLFAEHSRLNTQQQQQQQHQTDGKASRKQQQRRHTSCTLPANNDGSSGGGGSCCHLSGPELAGNANLLAQIEAAKHLGSSGRLVRRQSTEDDDGEEEEDDYDDDDEVDDEEAEEERAELLASDREEEDEEEEEVVGCGVDGMERQRLQRKSLLYTMALTRRSMVAATAAAFCSSSTAAASSSSTPQAQQDVAVGRQDALASQQKQQQQEQQSKLSAGCSTTAAATCCLDDLDGAGTSNGGEQRASGCQTASGGDGDGAMGVTTSETTTTATEEDEEATTTTNKRRPNKQQKADPASTDVRATTANNESDGATTDRPNNNNNYSDGDNEINNEITSNTREEEESGNNNSADCAKLDGEHNEGMGSELEAAARFATIETDSERLVAARKLVCGDEDGSEKLLALQDRRAEGQQQQQLQLQQQPHQQPARRRRRGSPMASTVKAPCQEDGKNLKTSTTTTTTTTTTELDNLEVLIVESWLDDHPHFVHDYFMRKASRQLIDDWLLAHAKVSTTSTTSADLVAPYGLSQSDDIVEQQPQVIVEHRELIGAASRSAAFATRSQQQQSSPVSNQIQQPRPPSRSGQATPVRKISATDFESRTGAGFLRPMVSTTPDGRQTFLQAHEIGSPAPVLSSEAEPLMVKAENTAAVDKEPSGELELELELCKEDDEKEEADEGTEGADEGRELKLIFELVKNICNDLDIRTLLHKILKNVAVLINADKSSLFLVQGAPGDPNRRLVSQLFDVDQGGDLSGDGGNEEASISIPWGTGIVGWVAESGEALNIANCYEDPRFTKAVDQRTGYITRHMLCAPIYDKRNEIIGVAQVINKRDGQPFSKRDELKFRRYLQFCGIGLRNAQSFEQSQLENRRNQVLLDLARMVFEEQSTIEQVVYRIMLHTQSLLECHRCQVLLIDDGHHDHQLDQLLHLPLQTTGARDRNRKKELDLSELKKRPEWRPQCCQGLGLQTTPAKRAGQDAEASAHGCPNDGAMNNKQPKLFSLVFDLECNGQDLVMHSNMDHQQAGGGSKSNQRRFPINIGITGYVATTGKTLNIEDAHQCERFDPAVDANSDFRHKSILCMPIRNGQREIIGVSQLINKKNGRPFNKNDEDLFEAFAIFCGLGIHNTLMYERVLKIMAKQRVTFDVLSYHATAPLEEAKKLNQEPIPSCFALNLMSLKFNDFSLDEQFMLKSCLRIFLDLDLMRRFQIDKLVFCNWILSVQKNYRKYTYHPIVGGNGLKASPVRYHNWRHAFNVTQMMFAILINTQICQSLGELETLALLIACLCHDLDHRGTNNSFQIKSASPLAQLYSTSTMEHHHFDQCVMILNSQGNQILANLSPEEYSRVIVLLEEAILATDLANYFQKREHFFQLVNGGKFEWQQNNEHRSLLRCMLMTGCDVAAITKPWSVQKIVANLVMSEFYQQGDIERQELKIEPIDMMNRDKMSKLPDMQIGFIDSICAPIYAAFARLFPIELGPLLDGCLSNRNVWVEIAQKNKSNSNNNNNNGTINTQSNNINNGQANEASSNKSASQQAPLVSYLNNRNNSAPLITILPCQSLDCDNQLQAYHSNPDDVSRRDSLCNEDDDDNNNNNDNDDGDNNSHNNDQLDQLDTRHSSSLTLDISQAYETGLQVPICTSSHRYITTHKQISNAHRRSL